MYPLINEKLELASTDMEKTEVLSKFSALVFTGIQASRVSNVPQPLHRGWGSKNLPNVSKEQVSGHLVICITGF